MHYIIKARSSLLLAGINTKKNVMGIIIFLFCIMTIISSNNRHIIFLRKLQQHFIYQYLFFQVMPLNLHIIIITKHIQPPLKFFLRSVFPLIQNGLRHISPKATGSGYQSLFIFLNQPLIYPRILTIHPLNKTKRSKLHQVLITYLILRQQYLMITVILFCFSKCFSKPVLHHIKLTPNNRLNNRCQYILSLGILPNHFRILPCLCHKLKSPEHVSMISNSQCWHIIFSSLFIKTFYRCRTIQQRILRMNMKMRELTHNEPFYLLLTTFYFSFGR